MKVFTKIKKVGAIIAACLAVQTGMAQQYEISGAVQSRAGDLEMMRPLSCKQFTNDEWGTEGEIIRGQ